MVQLSFELFMDGLVHMFVLFVVLTVIFIAVISTTETKALQTEYDNAITTHLQAALVDAHSDSKEQSSINLRDELAKSEDVLAFARREYNTPDLAVQNNNQSLYFRAGLICTLLFIMVVACFLVAKLEGGTAIAGILSHIALNNLTILVLVGAVEYMVFTRVAKKYIPILPSKITNTLIDDLKSSL